MKRFKTGFRFFVIVLFAWVIGLRLHADYHYAYYSAYWDPNGTYHESDSLYLEPTRATLDNIHGPESADFMAKPGKGWSVDYWCESEAQLTSLRLGTKIPGSDGQLIHTQSFGEITRIYLGVRFSYLKYDLTYDGNGAASPAGLRDVSYTNKFSLAAPQAPAGLSFVGWRDPSGTAFAVGAPPVSGASFAMLDDAHVDGTNVTLTAIWSTNSYTVTFNPGDGTVDVPSKSVTYGQPYGELPTPVWAEHEFQGWYLGQSQVTAESIVKITANRELEAKWSQKTYTLTFATTGDGQGTVDPVSATASSGQSVAVTATPAENSRFLSWSDGVTDATRAIVVKSNATYVANFEMKKYTVTFYWFCADGTPTNESQIVRWGEDAVEPQDIPIRTGYIRQGWEKSFTEVKSNLDIWAHYVPLEYTVTFLTDGGTGTGTVDQASRPWPYGEKFTVSATPANGSEFVKWSDGDVTNPREITVTGPAVYTAVFDLIRYDVTFNWRTGDNVATQETQKVEWGTAATPPADSAVDSRVGYSWTGWDVSTNEFVAVASNLTVNAIYVPHHYTVHYVADTKKPWSQDQSFVYDVPQELLSGGDLQSVDDRPFWKWGCGEATYDSRETVSNLTASADGEVVMRALWDLGELSRAMNCDNLFWEESTDWPGWKPGAESADREGAMTYADMCATVSTNGVLSFDWRASGTLDDGMLMYVECASGKFWEQLPAQDNEWHHEEIEITPEAPGYDPNYGFPLKIQLGFQNENDRLVSVSVKNVNWIPAGSSVDPTPEDAVTISSAEISGNKFKLSFTSDAKFDYNLLTNANLLIDSWGVMKSEPGTGATVTFEPSVLPGVPQMFYKVETIRKK